MNFCIFVFKLVNYVCKSGHLFWAFGYSDRGNKNKKGIKIKTNKIKNYLPVIYSVVEGSWTIASWLS